MGFSYLPRQCGTAAYRLDRCVLFVTSLDVFFLWINIPCILIVHFQTGIIICIQMPDVSREKNAQTPLIVKATGMQNICRWHLVGLDRDGVHSHLISISAIVNSL